MSREQADFSSSYNKADACIWISIKCKRIQNLSKKPKNASLPLCCSLKFTTGFERFIAWYTNKLLRRFWWLPMLYMREVTTFCFESHTTERALSFVPWVCKQRSQLAVTSQNKVSKTNVLWLAELHFQPIMSV